MDRIAMGLKIRQIREAKGLTQSQPAELTDLSDRNISRIEVGRVYPEFSTVTAIADALGITLDYLITDNKKLSKDIYVNEIIERIKDFDFNDLKHILAYIEFYAQNKEDYENKK